MIPFLQPFVSSFVQLRKPSLPSSDQHQRLECNRLNLDLLELLDLLLVVYARIKNLVYRIGSLEHQMEFGKEKLVNLFLWNLNLRLHRCRLRERRGEAGMRSREREEIRDSAKREVGSR